MAKREINLALRFRLAIPIVFTLTVFLPFINSVATTLQPTLKCFNLPSSQFADADSITYSEMERWCYYRDFENQSLFIFNADRSEVSAELSVLVDKAGFLTHGSLMSGRISYHRVSSIAYNPFSIPLTEPLQTASTQDRDSESELSDSAERVYKDLMQASIALSFRLQPLIVPLSGFALFTPWRGFWWPYKNQHLSDKANSPLAKYDRFIKARGLPAGSVSWENTHHRYKGISWEGHCNGWAASSILRAEPEDAKMDPQSGMKFSIDDQKGLLAEMDYCASTSFYGKRFRGRPQDNPKDISPQEFHKTITYYIGELQKPVIMDYKSGTPVDNHPVSAYAMEITRLNNRTIEVTADLTFHKYDSKTNQGPGPAPAYSRVYKYTLNEDADGHIIGGTWLSDNPDFIWVPLSIRDCARNNPFLDPKLVQEILDLPKISISDRPQAAGQN